MGRRVAEKKRRATGRLWRDTKKKKGHKAWGAAGTKRKSKHIRGFLAMVTSIIIKKRVRNLSMARLCSKTSKEALNIQYNQPMGILGYDD
ncbi:unnamed protein product [Prunus armeniaca]|uniref:Uncharacterized protein n=1 Tax=Prunus armeniaca TaxID=36596 RepID=A0A6J5UTD5_PRUAR|nr:unnamed protein product [Prunus armeniaca]